MKDLDMKKIFFKMAVDALKPRAEMVIANLKTEEGRKIVRDTADKVVDVVKEGLTEAAATIFARVQDAVASSPLETLTKHDLAAPKPAEQSAPKPVEPKAPKAPRAPKTPKAP